MLRYLGVDAFEDFFEEAIHVLGSEWGLQSQDLVKDAAEGPYVRLAIVGLVFPDFRGRIIWSASLCVEQSRSTFGDFRYIEVTEFHHK